MLHGSPRRRCRRRAWCRRALRTAPRAVLVPADAVGESGTDVLHPTLVPAAGKACFPLFP